MLSAGLLGQTHDTLPEAYDTMFRVKSLPADPFQFTLRRGHSYRISPVSIIDDDWHSPDADDSLRVSVSGHLADQKPDYRSYDDYYHLAVSYWDLNKIPEAEKMFLVIVNSKSKFYTGNYHHNSDIPGDTSHNAYGYGSYTSNYQNSASIYLGKIYIEKKEFRKALGYLEYADKKYPVGYNCGTGQRSYENELAGLYVLCYRGLDRYPEVIKLLIRDWHTFSNESLIDAIEKTYTVWQIDSLLRDAEASITCVQDTFQSTLMFLKETSDTSAAKPPVKYTSAHGTIHLFGYTVQIPPIIPDDGGTLSRENFVKYFKDTELYQTLSHVDD